MTRVSSDVSVDSAWEVGFPSIGVAGQRLAGSPKGTPFFIPIAVDAAHWDKIN